MLTITIPSTDMFNEESYTFFTSAPVTIRLEHSLLSISRWESKWKESYFQSQISSSSPDGSQRDYIRCMSIGKITDNDVSVLWTRYSREIHSYISDSMTATVITTHKKKKSKRQVVTSDLIYSWMVMFRIPFECEKWHLNRLMTLIEICNIQNSEEDMMSVKDVHIQNAELNAKRLNAT